jgi:hypothetical protein
MYLQKVKSKVRPLTKIAGSGSASGSISRRYGSADPDPDAYQKFMDPQHCKKQINTSEERAVLIHERALAVEG